MKGIVFTNFMDMVEIKFGIDMVDTIIAASDLASKGSYTSVGVYPHTEMVSLLFALEKETGVTIRNLLISFGEYLFEKLFLGYSNMLTGIDTSRDLLRQLDNVVHVEVAKLYPDAQLPRFITTELPDGNLKMHYRSERHLADLAEGLLSGCLKHYKDEAKIERSTQEDESVIFQIVYKQ
jgi:hypothetical protein